MGIHFHRKAAMTTDHAKEHAELIYLDYNATTPVDPRVADVMQPFLRSVFGNPSSPHAQGRAAREAIDDARAQAARLLGCATEGIIFTSGGTEANNHAIIGAAGKAGDHIVTTAVEHPAVTEVCRHLESRGVSTTMVPVDAHGMVDAEAVAAAFTDRTVLVSVMHANNEVGTIQPVRAIAEAARAKGILTHSDCAQSTGKIPVDMDDLGVDMLSVAGHKLYAPKGIGILAVREDVDLPNLMFGAGHEGGRRPGTENILEIAGLGEACRLISEECDEESLRLADLRDELQDRLTKAVPDAVVHGHPDFHLPNTLSIGFPGVTAAAAMDAAPHVAVSAGAACHGGGATISHVLAAMGVDPDIARGTLRFSLGRFSTREEIRTGAEAITGAIASLRS
jgi:cysteine desulfurase